MRIVEWIMKILGRDTNQATLHTPLSYNDYEMQTQPEHDDLYPAAKAQYEREKKMLVQKQTERLARVKRLGYDFDNVVRKDNYVSH